MPINKAIKTAQLGMDGGKARNILVKSLLYSMARVIGLDVCCRCHHKIATISELSIDHIVPWLDSENPAELYFDLENVAFSHTLCNYSTIRRRNVSPIS